MDNKYRKLISENVEFAREITLREEHISATLVELLNEKGIESLYIRADFCPYDSANEQYVSVVSVSNNMILLNGELYNTNLSECSINLCMDVYEAVIDELSAREYEEGEDED